MKNAPFTTSLLIISIIIASLIIASGAIASGESEHNIAVPERDGWVTNNTEINISIITVQNTDCRLFWNSSLIATHNSSINISISNVTEGNYSIVSSCTYTNNSNSTITRKIYVDQTKPRITISPDLNSTRINNTGTSLLININSTEPGNLTIIRLTEINNTNSSGNEGTANSTSYNSTGYNITATIGKGISFVNVSIQEGTNILKFIMKDLAGNKETTIREFNATITEDLCSNGELDTGEQDIDCGGSCTACIPYDISIDKETYQLGEQVDITVIGRSESVHELSLTGPAFNFTTTGRGIAGYFMSPSKTGAYRAKATFTYKNEINIIEKYFVVENSSTNTTALTVAIQTSANTFRPSQTISFTADISGGKAPYRTEWDFNEDYTIDSTASNPSYLFTSTGTKEIRLTVIDADNEKETATRNIHIKNIYRLNVKVKENVTLKNISGADIGLGNDNKETDSYGTASFENFDNTYLLTASKTGYYTFAEEISLSKNKTITINLTPLYHDINPPEITVLEPVEGAAIDSDSFSVKYYVSDITDVSCKHSKGDYANLFETIQDYHDVDNGSLQTFTVDGFGNGKSYWKVSCRDLYGNSEEKTGWITHNGDMTSVSGEGGEGTTQTENQIGGKEKNAEGESSGQILSPEDAGFDLQAGIRSIDNSLSVLKSYGEDIQPLVQGMKLEESANINKKQLKLLQRDLFNLQYRKMNEDEKEEERNKLKKQAEEIIGKTITGISLADSEHYVHYSTEEEIINATTAYLDSKKDGNNNEDIDDQKERWINANKDLSSLLTVSTRIFVADIKYNDGTKKRLTIVDKDIELPENMTGFSIIEIIPKEFSDKADKITFLQDVEIIKEDPIVSPKFEFYDSKQYGDKKRERFTYYIEGEPGIENAKRAQTLLTYSKLPKAFRQGLFSGFAIFESGNTPIDIKTSILYSAILSLIVYLLFFHFEILSFRNMRTSIKKFSPEKIKAVVDKALLSKKGKRLKEEIEIAQEHIESGRIEDAEESLEDSKRRIRALAEKEKNVINELYLEALHDLKVIRIRKGIEKAKKRIKEQDHEKAKEIFMNIREEARHLNEASKRAFRKDIHFIAERLNHHFISSLVKKAHKHLDKGERSEAKKDYDKIRILFRQGSRKVKEQTHRIAIGLFNRMAGNSEKIRGDNSENYYENEPDKKDNYLKHAKQTEQEEQNKQSSNRKERAPSKRLSNRKERAHGKEAGRLKSSEGMI